MNLTRSRIQTSRRCGDEAAAAGRTRELRKAIYEGSEYYASQTFNQSLKGLYRNGLITYDEALAAADNPDELKLEIRGISKGSRAADFDFEY